MAHETVQHEDRCGKNVEPRQPLGGRRLSWVRDFLSPAYKADEADKQENCSEQKVSVSPPGSDFLGFRHGGRLYRQAKLGPDVEILPEMGSGSRCFLDARALNLKRLFEHFKLEFPSRGHVSGRVHGCGLNRPLDSVCIHLSSDLRGHGE